MYTYIGIIVPTVMEMMPLLELLEQEAGQKATEEVKGIWRYHHTQIEQLHISIVHSGPGMVNAGMASEAMILHEQPQALINYGIAGAHLHEALPGDIVIATKVCAPFNGYLQTGGVLHSAFGIRWDDAFNSSPRRSTQRYAYLECDPALVSIAQQAAQVLIEQHAPVIVAPPGKEVRPTRIYTGVVSSADTYCRDEATFVRIRETFGSFSEDMESAAIGQVAVRHNLPFAIIRCLSNNDMLEILTQERKLAIYPAMAYRCALIIVQFLRLVAMAA